MTDPLRFRPSNATEGDIFQSRWCGRCAHDAFDPETGEGGCAILATTMAVAIDDPAYPPEWRREGPSGPRCTAFAAQTDGDTPFDPAAAIGLLL